MKSLIYGISLQLKLDIRSKTMLITCYLVPLLFFVFMGGIFTSINPESKNTLIQSMTVFGITMGAVIGLPPSLVEIYGSDIKNVYKANGVPLYVGVVTHIISSFIHLFIMSIIIFLVAPIAFNALIPSNLLMYFLSLILFIITTLSVGTILGLFIKKISKLTMVSQIIFLPSIMLSGIMFPVSMLPKILDYFGKLFPATWGYSIFINDRFNYKLFIPLFLILIISIIINLILLKKISKK